MSAGVKKGALVRLTEAAKTRLRGKCGSAGRHLGPFDPDDGYACWGCGTAHVDEFGDCVGVVLGPMDLGDGERKDDTFVDVRWQPSGLRYAYDSADLVIVGDA